MSIEHLSPGYKAVLSLLHDHQAEYLLVGGYAVRYYGYLRATRDLDLWTSRHSANVARIVAALRDFVGDLQPEAIVEALEHERRIVRISLSPLRLEILDPLPRQRPAVLLSYTWQVNLTGFGNLSGPMAGGEQDAQIELLTVQSGVMFEDCFAERTIASLDGIEVNIISLRYLKAIKQAGGRSQDLDDLAHLE